MLEIDILNGFFERKSISVSIYWLQCCLEWFKENNPEYTETSMCNEVLGQWLESDLREIEHPSLPLHVNKHKKHTLINNYAVQVMYVKDISRSAYSQLKQIRDLYNLTRGEIEAEALVTSGEGKRLLYLNITDGVQFINAFEYQHIPCLNTDIKPGTKLLLIAPLNVRNGEILLQENNVQILGGCVEDLLVCNAYENILARELNLPENPAPGRKEQPQIVNNLKDVSIDEDDDLFLNIPDNFEDQIIQENNDIFQDSLVLNLDDIEVTEPKEIPINETLDPFVYIKYLQDNSDKILNKTYKVKAEFFRVVEKLNVSKSRGWNMKFEIMDNSGTIVVDFLSSVIEKLMDLSPQEAIAENLKVKNKICESHEKISEALKNCKKKLDSYQYIMHLKFNQIDRPTVIDLETFKKEHFVQLKKRVESTAITLK